MKPFLIVGASVLTVLTLSLGLQSAQKDTPNAVEQKNISKRRFSSTEYSVHYVPFSYGLYTPARVERVLRGNPAPMSKELYNQLVDLIAPAMKSNLHFNWNDSRVIVRENSSVVLMIDGYGNWLQVDSWKQGRLTEINFVKVKALLDHSYKPR